ICQSPSDVAWPLMTAAAVVTRRRQGPVGWVPLSAGSSRSRDCVELASSTPNGHPGRELSLLICSKLALQLTTRRRTTVVANSALGHTLSLGCVIQARCAKLMLGDSGANPRWTQNRSFGRGGVRSASASIQEAT